jgi:hypothetical protein
LFLSNSPARKPDADKAQHPVAGFQHWMLGLKNDRRG